LSPAGFGGGDAGGAAGVGVVAVDTVVMVVGVVSVEVGVVIDVLVGASSDGRPQSEPSASRPGRSTEEKSRE
jgi:hypothetical protein